MARPASRRAAESPSLLSSSTAGGPTEEEAEFRAAIETYKTVERRPFPTWSEILEIAEHLGYKKSPVCAPGNSGTHP